MPTATKRLLYTTACLSICGGLLYLVVGLLAREWYAVLGGLLFVVAGTAAGWYAGKLGSQTGWRLTTPLIVCAGALSAVAVLVVVRARVR